MKKNRLSFALVTGAALTLAACGSDEPQSNETSEEPDNEASASEELETTEVTLYGVVDTQVSAQQMIAEEMGFFEDEGLTVESNIVQSGPDIGPLIASGDAYASFETTITNITLSSSGVDNVIIAPMANISGTQAVIAHPDYEINSAQDIEGATIGMVQGAGVTIALQNMADELGVNMDEVDFINMSPTDQIATLDNGNIDIMAAWEPWVTTGVDLGAEFLFSGSVSEMPEVQGDVDWMQYYSTFQVTEDFLEDNPNTVKALLRALHRATEYINEDREGALNIMDDVIEHLPREQIEEIMERNDYSMEVTDDLREGSDVIAEHLHNMDSIRDVPAFEDYTDFTLLEEVLND
ncbi:ABC transporter substrate-binding protein [Geomicrobium sediminis]|uniref:NitT/TauT family transport system substrate-binding protein n=1 Tax=Geomicrobium sediminis TaxID=1347788 RepID=A0ABS2PBR5_9BACL|nr:ABC transporter substrate-binding protein [Geomicrobium sediminis]MBM7632854.1 NitT/TauT family transport system substrate-binding protein [Geomicrobium sediminis]